MVNIAQIPLWAMILTMAVLAGLFVWVYTSLMRTRAQKLSVLVALPVGCLTLLLNVVAKGNSAFQAMLLFDDVMIGMISGGLVILPKARRLRNETGATETPLLTPKEGNKIALIITAVLAILIIGQAALFHRF